MRHAIMVMGYGDCSVLQETINVLDDDNIDFIIHWDKKYELPNLSSNRSRIYYLQKRVKVNWGSDSQTIAEKKLIEYVYSRGIYDYAHLISSNDIPLMTVDYFKNYFKPYSYYVGFLQNISSQEYDEFNEYYPIRRIKVKNRFPIIILMHYLNRLFHVNRLKGKQVEKGCNWFSMDIRYLKPIVEFKNFKMFLNIYTGDEIYIQTILSYFKPECIIKDAWKYSKQYNMMNSCKMALRYIDWLKGGPYVFKDNDLEELYRSINTNYAFARKIVDAHLVTKLFNRR